MPGRPLFGSMGVVLAVVLTEEPPEFVCRGLESDTSSRADFELKLVDLRSFRFLLLSALRSFRSFEAAHSDKSVVVLVVAVALRFCMQIGGSIFLVFFWILRLTLTGDDDSEDEEVGSWCLLSSIS